MKLKEYQYVIILLFFTTALISCTGNGKRPENPNDVAKDARGIEIYREGDCWVAEVISPTDSVQNLGVYIFPDSDNSQNIPDIEGAYIFKPSQRKKIMLFTCVYSHALKELDAQNIIKVVGDAGYMNDEFINEGLKNGNIIDGGSLQEPVVEKIIAAGPDMIVVSHYDGMDISKLEKIGIPIVYLRESAEQNPLGRAEWIKLIGLIAGKKEKADSIFDKVKEDYNSLVKTASAAGEKPTVMTETMYQGTWFVPGGKSYASQLIKDAGANYVWAEDNSEGSLQLSFETVLSKAQNADLWLIRIFGVDLTLDKLKEMDSRYMLFKPTKNNGVWSSNTQKVPFFDETPFHPELILKDYIKIFHPDLLPDEECQYFRQIK